jgi:hypothetical protein
MTVASIPFGWARQVLTGRNLHVVRVEGLLRFEGDALVLEFRETTFDASGTFTVERGEVRRVEVPLEQVAALTLRRRFLRPSLLVLEVHTLAALEAFPYASGSRLELRIGRAERERAREVCGLLAHRVADARLRHLEAGGE